MLVSKAGMSCPHVVYRPSDHTSKKVTHCGMQYIYPACQHVNLLCWKHHLQTAVLIAEFMSRLTSWLFFLFVWSHDFFFFFALPQEREKTRRRRTVEMWNAALQMWLLTKHMKSPSRFNVTLKLHWADISSVSVWSIKTATNSHLTFDFLSVTTI